MQKSLMRQVCNFYHPKPERFVEVCQRIFPYTAFDYRLARRTVSIPALLRYAGYPLSANQFCFHHRGHGTALSIYMHYDGFWYFKCADAEVWHSRRRRRKCGI